MNIVDFEEYKEQLRSQEKHVAALIGLVETGEEIVSVSVHKVDGTFKVLIHHLDCSADPPALNSVSLHRAELEMVIHALIEIDGFLPKEE
jgi:hypothetical protein